MITLDKLKTSGAEVAPELPICIAVLAMGGQGGGVLTDWIVATAEAAGWAAQSTSVPGVAQRTGATIYYVEMLEKRDGRMPVLSLMPTPGDIDLVLAAEFMEAGRSMLRGLVTPERTTLIASTHRSLAVSEKEAPGNGIADSVPVVEAAGIAAKRSILFDMQSLAERSGSVISAAMFGALAGSGVLPFARSAFEDAIRAGGKGVEQSLRAFAAAFERTQSPDTVPALPAAPARSEPAVPTSAGHPALDRLLGRLHDEFPAQARPMLYAGLQRLVDYQDAAYGGEYLDRMAAIAALDTRLGGAARDYALSVTAAKYLANAMKYDDVIRVADLKTRKSRFERVEREVGVRDGQLLYATEYMHPRMEEVIGTMPRALGHWLEVRPALVQRLDRYVNKGRRVRTGTIFWFAGLYMVSGMKRWRRSLVRHEVEMRHVDTWLTTATSVASSDYALAVEVLACRRLIKGYSDTHARGHSKFDRVMANVPYLMGRSGSATWLRLLREAALADETGKGLDGAVRTMRAAFEPLAAAGEPVPVLG